MSGTTPSCSQANIVPVLPSPVGISSKIKSAPNSSHACRTHRQKPGGGTYGTARTGSPITAATSPSFSKMYRIVLAHNSALPSETPQALR